MLYWVHLPWVGFELTTLLVIGTDSIGSCKSNYHMITASKLIVTYYVLIYQGVLNFFLCVYMTSFRSCEKYNQTVVSAIVYHIMLYWVHLPWVGFELTTLLVIGTDSIGSCKSNYHMITASSSVKVKECETSAIRGKDFNRWGVLNTALCDKVCQWLATGRSFSQGTSVSSTYKTDHHDITEILLKVALNNPYIQYCWKWQ
jgi:hypothetical protein